MGVRGRFTGFVMAVQRAPDEQVALEMGYCYPCEPISGNLVSTLIGCLMTNRGWRTIFSSFAIGAFDIHPLWHSELEIQALCYYVKRKSRIGNVFDQVSI